MFSIEQGRLRFNKGTRIIAGGSNRSRGWAPCPPHFNHCRRYQ